MKTHKENHSNTISVNPRKSFYRIILQIFVWALVIAFVSTIGVMWDGAGMAFPIVLDSSKGQVDLSPRNLYMMEYNRLNEELYKSNPNIDPRLLNRYIQKSSLTNTENAFTRQLFYQDINLTPSPKIFQEIQANTGLSSNFIEFQYAENYYMNPIGILPALTAPTVSDMYAIRDIQQLNMAIEILTLNKTNFLYTQISDKDKENYYLESFEQWTDSLLIQEIKTENRGQARQVINLLNKQGINTALEEIISNTNLNVVIQRDKVLTANSTNFSYFNDILTAYKTNTSTNTVTVAGPIYSQGEYYVAVLSNITSFDQLSPTIQNDITVDYLQKNYQKIAKQYNSEWNKTLKIFQEELLTNQSFSVIVNNVLGAVNHNTEPFTLLNKTLTNILGSIIDLPILTSPEIISSILTTSITETSPVINPKSGSDIYLVIRPLFRQYENKNNENTNNIYNDPELFQTVYQYKSEILRESVNSRSLKNRYKITVYPEVLTNLN